MTRITTLVFDAFGTLFQDSPEHWDAAMGAIIEQQGLDVSVDALNRVWLEACADFRNTRSDPRFPFQSYAIAWRDAFAEAFGALGLTGDPVAAAGYWINDMAHRELYPDTREALEAVSQKYRVMVLSNADDCFLDPALERLDFPFAAIMSSEGGRTYKPNPELFHTLLKQLEVSPEEAVYVGDRQLEDVKGARLAGLGTVWINRTGLDADPDLPAPDYCITSLLDLVTLFDD